MIEPSVFTPQAWPAPTLTEVKEPPRDGVLSQQTREPSVFNPQAWLPTVTEAKVMGAAVGVGVGMAVGIGVGAEVGAGVAMGMGVGVSVGTGVAVGAGVGLGLGVGAGVGVGTGVEVAVGMGVGADVGTGVAVGTGVGLGVGVGVTLGVSVGNTAATVPTAVVAAGATSPAALGLNWTMSSVSGVLAGGVGMVVVVQANAKYKINAGIPSRRSNVKCSIGYQQQTR